MLTLDAKTGSRIDMMPIDGNNMRLINSQTDRIYLGTKTGLLQCLHEVRTEAARGLYAAGHEFERRRPRHRESPSRWSRSPPPSDAEEPAEEEAMEAPADDAAAEEPAEEAMEAPAEEESPFE